MDTPVISFPWKKAVVAGMARSGRAVSRLLAKHGVHVLGTDLRSAKELGLKVSAPEFNGVDMVLGEQPLCVLENADVLVTSPGIPKTAPLLQEAQRRSILILSELEVASRVARAPMAAVTGTNGKSTVVNILGEIAKAHGKECVVAGNVGLALSEVVEQIPGDGILIVEVSSYQLEDIEHFHPRVSCILNITPDHLDRYRGLEHYAQTKWRITENQTQSDWLVLPAGDPSVVPPPGLTPRQIFFGTADASGKTPVATITGDTLMWDDGKPQRVMEMEALPLLGQHNHLNAAAAVALAYGLGLDPMALETGRGLQQVRALPHRMEPVGEVDGVCFIDDSKATNPEATLAALNSLEGPLVLVAGGQAKESDYGALVPALDPSKTLGIALIGEAQDQLAQDWASAGVDIHLAGHDLQAAVVWAWERARTQGALVLLSPGCASFDMFRDFEHRGNEFRDIVLGLRGGAK